MSAPPHAFLTGAASGIGRCVARRWLARGGLLCAVDVDAQALHRVADEDGWDPERSTLAVVDVRDTRALSRALDAAEARAPVDVMMNVAGVLRPQWCHELDEDDVDLQIDVNIKGVIHGTRLAAAHMIPRGRGHVINVASMAAFAPIPGISVYSATKFAVRAFSLCAATELAPHGLFVSTVCPDAVETPMLVMQEAHDASAITFSGGRPLEADEIARIICEDVLHRRPREIAIPPRRRRLAILANAFPWLADRLYPLMLRRGFAHRDARISGSSRRPPRSAGDPDEAH